MGLQARSLGQTLRFWRAKSTVMLFKAVVTPLGVAGGWWVALGGPLVDWFRDSPMISLFIEI